MIEKNDGFSRMARNQPLLVFQNFDVKMTPEAVFLKPAFFCFGGMLKVERPRNSVRCSPPSHPGQSNN